MHVNVYHSQFMYVFKGIHFNSDAIPDPCDPDPCQNNGTCDSVSGNATCACPPEYTGPTPLYSLPRHTLIASDKEDQSKITIKKHSPC
jgi:hypothetical protein